MVIVSAWGRGHGAWISQAIRMCLREKWVVRLVVCETMAKEVG